MSDWKKATIETITRLRSVWALNPALEDDDKARLFTLARTLTIDQGETSHGRFWSVLVNTLRILVASEIDKALTEDELFARDGIAPKSQEDGDETAAEQFARLKREDGTGRSDPQRTERIKKYQKEVRLKASMQRRQGTRAEICGEREDN